MCVQEDKCRRSSQERSDGIVHTISRSDYVIASTITVTMNLTETRVKILSTQHTMILTVLIFS
jgi:hypothetical protein